MFYANFLSFSRAYFCGEVDKHSAAAVGAVFSYFFMGGIGVEREAHVFRGDFCNEEDGFFFTVARYEGVDV